jgi:hypothetical protein
MSKQDVSELFVAFRQQCIWLRECYNTHEALYGSGSETTDVLERVAVNFFQDLSHILREYCYLQVCRITDQGSDNLTVSTLNAALRKADKLTSEIEELGEGMLRYRKLINRPRNKIIAHADTQTIMRGNALGDHPAAEVDAFFECMQGYCDAVGRAVGEGPLDFRWTPGTGDALDLIKILERGVAKTG